MNPFLPVALGLAVSVSSCVRQCPPALSHDQVVRREFNRGNVQATRATFLPDLSMTVVVLSSSHSTEFQDAAKRLLNRHPFPVPADIRFWSPDIKMALEGWTSVIRDGSKPEKARVLISRPRDFACQVFGVDISNKKMLVYNFVPERRLDFSAFYIRPDDFYDFAWLGGGTVLVGTDHTVSWKEKH